MLHGHHLFVAPLAYQRRAREIFDRIYVGCCAVARKESVDDYFISTSLDDYSISLWYFRCGPAAQPSFVRLLLYDTVVICKWDRDKIRRTSRRLLRFFICAFVPDIPQFLSEAHWT